MNGPEYFRTLYDESQASGDACTSLYREDLALARACNQGSPAAWECFARRFREPLYAAALVIARNDSVARELADSVFGDMFLRTRLASYTGRGSLEGWLKAVLSQAYIDRYRTQRRVVSLDDRLAVMQATLFTEPPAAVDSRLNEAIKEAFLSLPGEQRYLLAGYFFDQRTLAELARTLGVHESTVSRRIHRLICGLRRRITRALRQKGMSIRQVQESFRTDVRDLSVNLRSQLAGE